MTKTELQVALAQATQTNKKTAGTFLDTLSTLAYKEIKKNGEFVLPRLWQVGETEEEGTHRLQSQDATEDQDSSQDCRQIPSRQGGKGRGSRSKEVVSAWDGGYPRDLKAGFGMKSRKHAPHRDVDCSRTFF
jgi:hypothetical protein